MEEAIKEMNGQDLDGNNIVVETAKGPKERKENFQRRSSGFKLQVEGLAYNTSWQDLKDFARGAGQPTFTVRKC